MIPQVPLVTVEVRQPNLRFLTLCLLAAEGKMSPALEREFDALCKAMESEQDNPSDTLSKGE